MKTYSKIWRIATGQRERYTTGCMLDYNDFKEHYKMIAINLSKRQAFNVDPKAIHQMSFSGNVDGANDRIMSFINDEAKQTILVF